MMAHGSSFLLARTLPPIQKMVLNANAVLFAEQQGKSIIFSDINGHGGAICV